MSNTSKRDAPCRHCEERHTFCHTTCEKYAKYRSECEQRAIRNLDKRLAESQAHSFLIDQNFKGKKKYRK